MIKPSYKELFVKILVSYGTMEPNFIYYLDGDDYHVKRVDKKAFNYFQKHYAEFTYSDDPNSEEYLFISLILENGKYILPAKLSETELLKSYEEVKDGTSYEQFKNEIYSRTINVWLDYHNLYEIECDDQMYSSIFTELATIFVSNLFTFFSNKNIIHYQNNGQHFFYLFNHRDMSLTIATNYFGLSNIQCMVSHPEMFDKAVLRSLREAYVITFKKESRCTNETISLYEKYENEYTDFGQYIPKIAHYKYGLLQENILRLYEGQELYSSLEALIKSVYEIVNSELFFNNKQCIRCSEQRRQITVEIDPEIQAESKEPFINLHPYRQFATNVKINKGQRAEFILRVSSTKKISKTTKATIYECLLLDADSDDVLYRNFVVSSNATVQAIISSILEYGYTNGYPESVAVSNVLDSHIFSIITCDKTKVFFSNLPKVKEFDKEDKDPDIAVA